MPQTVLLVDDEPIILNALVRNLRQEPYRVLTAGSASQAMDLMQQTPADVIVSDDEMPGVSGVEFLSQLRLLYPATIRLMLTGQVSIERTLQAINDGHVFRFLTKPCPPETLIEALRHALEHKRLMDHGAEAIHLLRRVSGVLRVLAEQHPSALAEAGRSAADLHIASEDFTSSSFIADELDVQVQTISALHPALVRRPST